MKDDFELISQMTGIESIAINKAWTEERRSREVAAGDSQRRLPLLFARDSMLYRIRKEPAFIQFMAEMKARWEGYQREFDFFLLW